MIQLAEMQMEPFLLWHSVTCSWEIVEMRWERLLCAGAWQTLDDIRVEFVVVRHL